jgi:hypothetical protein
MHKGALHGDNFGAFNFYDDMLSRRALRDEPKTRAQLSRG